MVSLAYRSLSLVAFALIVFGITDANGQNRYGNTPGTNRYGSGNSGATNPYGNGQNNATSTPPSTASAFSLSATPRTTPRPSNQSASSNRQPSSNMIPIVGGGEPAFEPTKAHVTKGSGKLPNSAGQVWREYDIRPYTQRASTEERPQQAIIDWVLRETGYEAWHSETFGILNASAETLTVYHTPAMQAIVANVVDRFVNSPSSNRSFSMRIMTVRNPDWRARALGMMTPIPVQSPGLQGWIMPKENFALLLSDLGRRSDVREYNAANQVVANGRRALFSTMRERGYVKGIVPVPNTWPGYQPEMGALEEGASLEFNPLLSLDRNTAESVVKLRLNQIEKMRPVTLDLAAPNGQSGQRLQVEVPQMTMANLHERFRWPADQVLILSMGMVATPGPESGNSFTEMIPMLKSPPRADALLFVEVRDARAPAPTPGSGVSTASRPATSFSGRY